MKCKTTLLFVRSASAT